nr:retrotransposon Orf1 [Tanacetum cinerariifolium]
MENEEIFQVVNAACDQLVLMVYKPEFESYGPKSCKIESKNASKNIPNELKESTKVKESSDVSLVKKMVSNDKLEKKTVVPTDAKIEFVKAKQQEKQVRKPVKYAEMYRSQGPRGNQRNWNNLKSQQLESNFVMYNKACFVCGSFEHVQANCNYHQRKRVVSRNTYTRVNYNNSTRKTYPNAHRNMALRAVLLKAGLRPLNTARPVNTAHPKTTVHCARPMPRPVNTVRPNSSIVNVVWENQGHPQQVQEDQGYIDRRCSRHMTRNMSYLLDFKEFNGGYVTFGRVNTVR